jgi:hypothetical protein
MSRVFLALAEHGLGNDAATRQTRRRRAGDGRRVNAPALLARLDRGIPRAEGAGA